jgi:hypothetical protein
VQEIRNIIDATDAAYQEFRKTDASDEITTPERWG